MALPDELLIGNTTIERTVGPLPDEHFKFVAGVFTPMIPNNTDDEFVNVGEQFYIDGSDRAWFDPAIAPGTIPANQRARLGFDTNLNPILESDA